MSSEITCPSEEEFAKAVSTGASEPAMAAVVAHLEACSSCAKLFAEMREIADLAKHVSWKAPSEAEVRRLAGRIVADATSSVGLLAKERSWRRPTARAVESVRQRVLLSGERTHKRAKVTRWGAFGVAFAVVALAGTRISQWRSPVAIEIAADPSPAHRPRPASEAPPVSPGPIASSVNETPPEPVLQESVVPRESRPSEARPHQPLLSRESPHGVSPEPRSPELPPAKGPVPTMDPSQKEAVSEAPAVVPNALARESLAPPLPTSDQAPKGTDEPSAPIDRKEVRQESLQDLRLRREEKREDKKEAREERREERKELREERRDERKEKREERRERRAK